MQGLFYALGHICEATCRERHSDSLREISGNCMQY